MTQFFDHFKSRVALQFINGISRVLQTVVNYFNGTIILTFAKPALLVLFVIFDLNLNDLEYVMLLFG